MEEPTLGAEFRKGANRRGLEGARKPGSCRWGARADGEQAVAAGTLVSWRETSAPRSGRCRDPAQQPCFHQTSPKKPGTSGFDPGMVPSLGLLLMPGHRGTLTPWEVLLKAQSGTPGSPGRSQQGKAVGLPAGVPAGSFLVTELDSSSALPPPTCPDLGASASSNFHPCFLSGSLPVLPR